MGRGFQLKKGAALPHLNATAGQVFLETLYQCVLIDRGHAIPAIFLNIPYELFAVN